MKNFNIFTYFANNEIISELPKEYNLIKLNDDDINENFLKKIRILIITKNNEYLFKITKKIKIIVFTNISKYINATDYVYYANIDELAKYIQILNNNTNKTFGIIVPIYNSYEYLDNCVISLLNQTFGGYKIFLCDDYSNIDEYNKFKIKYSSIKNLFMFRNSKNVGKFLTINMMLDKINTDYFLILDSDDKLNKNRLLYDLINLNNPNNFNNDNIYCVQSKYIRFDKEKKNIIENDYGHNSITFKFTIIKSIGYYCPNRFGSDTEYIMRIKKILGSHSILKYDKITYIAITRTDDTNLTKIYSTKTRKIFIDKVINIYANITNPEKLFSSKTDYFVDLVNYSKNNKLILEDYKKCYLDLINLDNDKLLKHWKEFGIIEGRLPNISLFYYSFPNFNLELFKTNNKNEYTNDMFKICGWVFLKDKKNYIKWLTNNNFNVEQINNINDENNSEIYIIKKTNNTNNINNNDNVYNFKDFILNNNIKYINVSDALNHFESRICDKFNLIKYNKLCDKFENVVFFGLYNKSDYIKITNHIGNKFLMWGGTDANVKYDFRKNILSKIKYYYDITNLSISNDINNSLGKCGIISIPIYLNMVNLDIFKPVKKYGKSIYIYNGFTKGNEEIYGKSIYQKVIEKIPEYNIFLAMI